jgi:DNA-binding transcriptional ArsR family regulator
LTEVAQDIDVALVAETFKLLGDPTRLRILLACLDGPRSVGEIAAATGASQSLVSHHLRLLRGARLVKGTRDARQVFYQAADQHVRHMIQDVIEHSAEEH